MTDYNIELIGLTKTFGRRSVYKNINSVFAGPNVIGISGKNGSGKTTFVKTIAGLISPTKGKVIHKINDKIIESDKIYKSLGFVAPYLVLYDEFTALENLRFFVNVRGLEFNEKGAGELLKSVNLADRKNDYVKTYSSGMKQRLKYAFALIHNPELLIFDEPTSNLDVAGKEIVYGFINELSKTKLIILASNEESDLAICNMSIEIENYK